jgi:hypothetical protein
MNEHAFGAADGVVALTDQEMAELVGGNGYVAYAIGYAIGFLAGLIVNTA